MNKLTLFLLFLLLQICAFAQGRVVINEYMPWAGNGNTCNTTSEFIELYNFGPGPVNIGCYVLTNGIYSVTIPPNTIIQPNEYYVLAGEDIIPKGCANTNSAVQVNLNWNKCNCTNVPIPTNKGGFFTDNGSANERVVLLDPTLQIMDAIIRKLPGEPTSTITPYSYPGTCSLKPFNLSSMNISYETVGESTGSTNSYARKVNGDCEWMKETQQSANGDNQSIYEQGSVIYNLTVYRAVDCDNRAGAISIGIEGQNVSSLFPMNYVIAYAKDDNTLFEEYISGSDPTSPRVDVEGLKAGRYRITLSPAKGCNYKTFDFSIQSCQPSLPLQVLSFKHLHTKQSRHSFEWTISEVESMLAVDLEQSIDNNVFTTAAQINVDYNSHGTETFSATIPASRNKYFRLRITLKNGAVTFSPTINTNASVSIPVSRLWPNPTKGTLNVETGIVLPSLVSYKIYNLQGSLVDQGSVQNAEYQYSLTVPVYRLPKGLYQLFVFTKTSDKPISFRFVKE